MKSALRTYLIFLLGVVLTLGVLWSKTSAEALRADAAGGPRYSVISTDGSHLIVVDNGTNKIYFYAIDKEGKVGDELKMRGSADLTEVGKPGIKPMDARPQK
jgi:hypothetical protein